jgi:PBSX family phage terminase large subunit
MSSAEQSVIPDFINRMEDEGDVDNFNITAKSIINKKSSSLINFTGLQTSAGQQTAKVKSLSELTIFVIDEAEEVVDYDLVEKIQLSARKEGKDTKTILVLNPSDKSHFTWKEYIENTHEIKYFDGVPVPISTDPRVEHIHVTYMDNLEHLNENFLSHVAHIKATDPEKYAHIVIGTYSELAKGQLYSRAELNWYKGEDLNRDLIEHKAASIDVAGGGIDNTAGIFGFVIGRDVYIDEVFYSREDYNYTFPMLTELINKNNPEVSWVENNGVGQVYAHNLADALPNNLIIGYHESSNKHAKIVSNSAFIKRNFYFRSDYQVGSDYDRFMKDMFAYSKNKKENRDNNDDSPDVSANLAKFLQLYLSGNWDNDMLSSKMRC